MECKHSYISSTKAEIVHMIEVIDKEIQVISQKAIANQQLAKLKKRRKDLSEKLSRLEALEKMSLDERTLKVTISEDTKTLPLMDTFEGINGEGFGPYDRIVVENIFHMSLLNHPYNIWIKYIIERLSNKQSVGDITMTEFKSGILRWRKTHMFSSKKNMLMLQRYTENQLIQYFESHKEIPNEVLFENPYRLRAQNSSNRTGYGNEYYGDVLIHEGTLYGETTDYAFVGVLVSRKFQINYY